MAKLSKRARAIKEKVEVGKQYPLEEAVSLLKECATAKFNESVEVAINLGIDAKKSDQAVRGATTLPHGTGNDVRVAVNFSIRVRVILIANTRCGLNPLMRHVRNVNGKEP